MAAKDAATMSANVRDAYFQQHVCYVVFPIKGIYILGDRFSSTLHLGDRFRVKPERNAHARGGIALTVHLPGSSDVVGRVAATQCEALAPFVASEGFQFTSW